MATIKEIKELALHAARGTAPANYSNENVNVALREEMKNLASSVNEFMRNRYDIYDIIISTEHFFDIIRIACYRNTTYNINKLHPVLKIRKHFFYIRTKHQIRFLLLCVLTYRVLFPVE